LDVTDKEGMANWLLKLDDEDPVDLIIANAGATVSTLGLAGKLDEAAHRVYDVNVYGTFNTIFPLIPRMKDRKYGQIAIMSSASGLGPVRGMFEYSSSKSALKVMAESLRWLLYRDGIHVNALVPGFFDSQMTRKNKGRMRMMDTLTDVTQMLTQGIANDDAVCTCSSHHYAVGWLLLQILPDDLRDTLAKLGWLHVIAYHAERSDEKKEINKEGKSN